MRFLHTMLRVRNLDTALKFYQDALGLKEVRRIDNDKGRFTLVFLCAPEDEELLRKLPKTRGAPLVERRARPTWRQEKRRTARSRSTSQSRPCEATASSSVMRPPSERLPVASSSFRRLANTREVPPACCNGFATSIAATTLHW